MKMQITAGLSILGIVLGALAATAQKPSGVAATVHNLSVSGPGEVRSLTETEICKFCHISHTEPAAQVEPLWSRSLSTQQYRVPTLRSGRDAGRPAPQPDGSSRLCLSCHDGTIALGDVAGESRPVSMTRPRLSPGRRGYLGTDLSGSHPISFVVSDEAPSDGMDMGIKPLYSIQSNPDVRLDAQGKMQCTTCHDPHVDRYYQPGQVPRFWVKSGVTEVCLTCHQLR